MRVGKGENICRFISISKNMVKYKINVDTDYYNQLTFNLKWIRFYPKYMYYQLDSATFKHYTEIVKAGTTFFSISQAAVGRYIATLPLSEQQSIADYLDTKTANIDRIVETINTQIEKLKELCKTLINDVVIGKIKVVK